jgi:carbonyl reductase 1
MSPFTQVGIVTGSNKGIGLAIIRQLSLQYPSSYLHSSQPGSLFLYLTARDRARGEQAIKQIYADKELKRKNVLAANDGEEGVTVKFQELDISDAGSVERFRSFVEKEHPEGVDFLINNAAIAMDGFSEFTYFSYVGLHLKYACNDSNLPSFTVPHLICILPCQFGLPNI